MSNIIPINQASKPNALVQRRSAGVALNKNFAGGVRDSFPMLSIKGRTFRIRKDGAETPLVDPNTRMGIPYLDVVMLNGSEHLSKAYYASGFVDDETAFGPPDCWSLDSIRPDPSVANKVSPTCANCPKNEFGSAPSRNPAAGKRGGKACADSRRVAVMMPGHLGRPENPLVFLLKVPATSLKNLKNYAQILDSQGWEPAACVTRLFFDTAEAYPKLIFNFVDGLDDVECKQAFEIAESKLVSDMLQAPGFDDVATQTAPAPTPALEPRVRQEAPVFGEAEAKPEPAAEVPMRRAAPVQQTVKAANAPLIELPDGKLFNPATGEYIEPVAEQQVAPPAEDPATIPLPDGRFFNTTTQKFVTGPLVGAPEIGATPVVEAPVKRTRAPRTKKESPAPEVKAQADAAPVDKPVGNGQTAPVVTTTSGVEPAPAALESLLNSLLPKS